MVGRVQRSVTAPLPPPSTIEVQQPKVNTPSATHVTASLTPSVATTGHVSVVGDTSTRDTRTHTDLAGGLAVRLGTVGGGASVMFSDLPKSVQTDVKAYIEQYKAAESMSMSPRTREFLRAAKGDDGFDVTFLERDWTGKSRGEVSQRFGAAPLAPTGPTTTGDALTSLDLLRAPARTAIEARIAMLNDMESMSMSPKTYAFVSATPLSDGGFTVTLMAKGFMGGGDASTHHLASDGSFR